MAILGPRLAKLPIFGIIGAMSEISQSLATERRQTILEFGFMRYVIGQVVAIEASTIVAHEQDLTDVNLQTTTSQRPRSHFPARPVMEAGTRYSITTYAHDFMPPSGIEIRDVVTEVTVYGAEFSEADALHSTFA
jgi:hypothetical protein